MQTLTMTRNTVLRDLTLVLIASFAICLSGQIAIPLGFTPVPMATRNAVVLLIAVLLGPKRGSAAVFAFLAQGAFGLPVFSNGAFGFAHLIGPSGGYLLGYLIAAYLVGYIAEKKKTIGNALLALGVGNLTIYLVGSLYLSLFVGIQKVFILGIAPFIIGDLLKMAASLKILDLLGWKKQAQCT